MQSICVCCAAEHPELSHTAWKAFMGFGVGFFWFGFVFSFFLHFEGLAFLIFFHILKWLERLVL